MTPGASGPATPGAMPSGPGYTPVLRGPSSRQELDIAWKHPVYKPETKQVAEGETVALAARRALSSAAAFAHIAGKDPRPLLVLRDCHVCTGTDDALMTRQADNERTMLLSRWFHCVRLAPDVLQPDHPFHALFAGESPPHLFVAQADGSGRIDLKGDQSRAELWDAMGNVMAAAYQATPKSALTELGRILDSYDELDMQIAEKEKRLDSILESDGPESRKFLRCQDDLVKLRAKRDSLRESAVKISNLPLRPIAQQAAPAAKQG